jgi:hypothetical protein
MTVTIDPAGNIIDTSQANAPVVAGSVYSLLSPATYSAGSVGAGGGLTAPAQANFANFLQGAFDTIGSVGSGQFSALNSTFNTWATWQGNFMSQVGNVFQSLANKSAKAPTGLFGSIFGF